MCISGHCVFFFSNKIQIYYKSFELKSTAQGKKIEFQDKTWVHDLAKFVVLSLRTK